MKFKMKKKQTTKIYHCIFKCIVYACVENTYKNINEISIVTQDINFHYSSYYLAKH